MTFRDVIMKNFVRNLRKYLSYFLSGVFCVAMFFTYATLVGVEDISKSVETYPMDVLMIVTCLMISVFSVIFINYSHSNFINNKKKELGTYMVIGMDNKDCTKLLLTETIIIASASILVGLVVGAAASRLFGLIVKRIIEVDDVSSNIEAKYFFISIGVFVLVYAFCFISSNRKMKKQDLSTIIKSKRKVEAKPFGAKNVILAFVGIALLTFSVVFIFNVAKDSSVNYKMWVVLAFIVSGFAGTFLIASNLISCMVALSGKGKKSYMKMLSNAGISFKFKQNMKIIIVLTMLASMIVLLVGSPIALLNISKTIANDACSDLEYAILDGTDDNFTGKISGIDTDAVTDIEYVYREDGKIVPVFTCEAYNEKYETDNVVEKGTVLIINTSWVPGSNGYTVGEKIKLGMNGSDKEIEVGSFAKGKFDGAALFVSGVLYLMNREDYDEIKASLYNTKMHKISLTSDWLDREDAVEELNNSVGERGITNSRIYQYNMLKHGYSVFLFVSCSMCFMFFISTGFVLYFKQYNDIDEDREQFVQLYKIGIPEKEVKKSIRKKMAVVYFVPLLGCIMGIAIMYYMSMLFGGGEIVDTFMSRSFIGLFLYAGSQILFYIFLQMKYTKDVVTINR